MIENVWQEIVNMAVQYKAQLLAGVGFVLAFFVLWILVRRIRLWYWKVGESLEAMHSIENEIVNLKEDLNTRFSEETEAGNARSARLEESLRANGSRGTAIPVVGIGPQPVTYAQPLTYPQPAVYTGFPVYTVQQAPQGGLQQQTTQSSVQQEGPAGDTPQPPDSEVTEAAKKAGDQIAAMEAKIGESMVKEKNESAEARRPEDTGFKPGRYEDRECGRDKFGRVYTRDEIEANIKA